MVQEADTADGSPFYWVVKARFDLFWLAPCPPAPSFSRFRVNNAENNGDMFLVLPRALAESMLTIVDNYRRCRGAFFCSVSQWLQASGAGSVRIPLPFVVRRGNVDSAPDACNQCSVTGAAKFAALTIVDCVSLAYNVSKTHSKRVCSEKKAKRPPHEHGMTTARSSRQAPNPNATDDRVQ